jgi:hypothetical protein
VAPEGRSRLGALPGYGGSRARTSGGPIGRARAALFASRWHHGALGALRIDSAGESSIERFGICRLVAGRMSLLEVAG